MLASLAGCSSNHSLSRDELQTKYRASISLSSETREFLQHLDGHRYSDNFIKGHLSYLQKQGTDIQSDLANTSVEAGDAASLNALKIAIGELTQMLSNLSGGFREPTEKSAVDRLRSLRQHLEQNMPR
jgi:hypothetical protein